MALTLSTANAVLKNDYQGAIREQLNNNCFLLSQIDKNTKDVVGSRAAHAVHIKRSSGIGARADGGTLPTAASQTYLQPYIPIRSNYARIQITGKTIEAMKSDRGAFTRAIKSEMDGARNDEGRDVNRQVFGTSNGVIAQCGTTSSATTVVLASATDLAALYQLYNDGGMVVDIGTVADPVAVATGRTVTSVDIDNKTIAISGAAVTTSSSHYVFRTGSGGASSESGLENDGQVELTGIRHIVDDATTLHQISYSTYPVWKATVKGNSGTNRNLSEALVSTAYHTANRKSGKFVDLMVCSDGVQRAAAALMTSMRRNVDTVDLKAGYSGMRWSFTGEGDKMGKPLALKWDQDCPGNRIFGLATSELVEYVMLDWTWDDTDGNVLSRVQNQDAFEAFLKKYHELACIQRNAHFVVEDLNEVSA